MNLFTHVKVESRFLPPLVKELNGWQTRDVVEPSLETLKIENCRLIYEVYEYEEIHNAMFGGFIHPVGKQEIDLDYHGAMNFYTIDDKNEMVEMVARFNHGNLFWVKSRADVAQLRRNA